MNEAMAHLLIAQLRGMTVATADATLCRMHNDDLFTLGDAPGINMPVIGGDKPALFIAALFSRGGRA